MPELHDTLGSDKDPLLALITKKSPEEILQAWLHCLETTPERLEPNYAIDIELELGAECNIDQVLEILRTLGSIVGTVGENIGTVNRKGNFFTLSARLFKGYESVIAKYLREYIGQFINSSQNTFIRSIAVRKDGADPMVAIMAGKKPDLDAMPGYFQVFNIRLNPGFVIQLGDAEKSPEDIAGQTAEEIDKTTKE